MINVEPVDSISGEKVEIFVIGKAKEIFLV